MNALAYCVTVYAALSALGWLLAGAASVLAVLSPRVRDSLWERIGLAWAGIGSFGAAYHVLTVGVVSELMMFVSLGYGFYVTAVFLKHWNTPWNCNECDFRETKR